MATTYVRATQLLTELQACSNDLRNVHGRIKDFVQINQAVSIDWGNASLPASLLEDANGNLQGQTFTRQQVSNLIGTLATLIDLLDNQGHIGNINLIASPTVR